MTEILYTVVGNLGRRLTEWADRKLDDHERHVIDLYQETWTAPAVWWKD